MLIGIAGIFDLVSSSMIVCTSLRISKASELTGIEIWSTLTFTFDCIKISDDNVVISDFILAAAGTVLIISFFTSLTVSIIGLIVSRISANSDIVENLITITSKLINNFWVVRLIFLIFTNSFANAFARTLSPFFIFIITLLRNSLSRLLNRLFSILSFASWLLTTVLALESFVLTWGYFSISLLV